ncbi:MAG: NADH dehydrogenase FAD-containing subunit [Deltaproteobacteria bacterium]|nr:NADH dehydrogenase FAD-containing subunit [Deltaproteobacteria bacterium]
MLQGLVLIPAAGGFLSLMLKGNGLRRAILLGTALAHLAMTMLSWQIETGTEWGGLLRLDGLGQLFLTITSVVFAVCAVYGIGYLAREKPGVHTDFQGDVLFANAPEARFSACLLFFLSAMTLVCISWNFGLLWVGIEATTLASAPLIYFHRHKRSLEATWKYLMLCSVGIAIALLGNIMLSFAVGWSGSAAGQAEVSMNLDALIASAPQAHLAWFKAAFICILVGYGTKMGLAPMHAWLPDAHSEAPSMVSALLSALLLNCAFLGILRAFQVADAAGMAAFAGELLVWFGLLSLAIAAAFIVRQNDYKRMLAYSSVEHMGILSLGIGIGGGAVFGSMLHAVNHSMAKAMLFMLAGNILAMRKTKNIQKVQGLLTSSPWTGALWMFGFLAIVGSPPFGLFVSEFLILKAAFEGGMFIVAGLILFFLAVIFTGMVLIVLPMVQGDPGENPRQTEPWLSVLPPLVLGIAVALLGLYLPAELRDILRQAAELIMGKGV